MWARGMPIGPELVIDSAKPSHPRNRPRAINESVVRVLGGAMERRRFLPKGRGGHGRSSLVGYRTTRHRGGHLGFSAPDLTASLRCSTGSPQ
jgi:hypothetical protein